jgi:hypothetical protein
MMVYDVVCRHITDISWGMMHKRSSSSHTNGMKKKNVEELLGFGDEYFCN